MAGRAFPLWTLLGVLSPGALILAAPALAQVIPDGTLGNEASRVTAGAISAGDLVDMIEGGAQRGGNLFHSFLEFNVEAGQRLYFANPIGVESILTRVTGENPSTIFGILGVEGSADLFLINPNGLVFGETASLDIAGSFFASTAEAIALGNEVYSAVAPEQGRLLTLNPSALISTYLTAASGPIESRGQLAAGQTLALAAPRLDLQNQVAAGGDLALLATDTVQIRDGADRPFVGFAGGSLLVQGNDQVDIVALSHGDSGLFAYGDMVLRSANPVGGDAHYWSGGSFRVESLDGAVGDLISPIDPVIRALGNVEIGAYRGASLHILAGGAVNIGTAIITAPAPGAAGVDFLQETITLSDGTVVEIDGGAQPTLDVRAGVEPGAIGLVPPGNISWLGTDVLADFSTTTEALRADITIGDVWINSPNGQVLLTNQYEPNINLAGGSVFVNGNGFYGDGIDLRGLTGQGGSAYLDARDDVEFFNSFVDTSGAGNVGDINISAGVTVRFERLNRRTGAFSSLTSEAGGNGGDIRIHASNIEVFGGAQLRTSTSGRGNAGNVIINAQGQVHFDELSSAFSGVERGVEGKGGNIIITTRILEVTNGAQLVGNTSGIGNAGNIIVYADDRVVLDGSNADRFRSSIFARVDEEATGRGGDIEINTNSLEVTNGGLLTASTSGIGDAGDIRIYARDHVVFDGSNSNGQFNSGAFTRVRERAIGTGGNISINATSLEVTDRATLLADTEGIGNAGNIVIDVSGSVIFSNSDAFSQVGEEARGSGGNIEINAYTLELRDGGQLLANTRGDGDAGNVLLNVYERLNLEGSSSDGKPSGIFTDNIRSGTGQGNTIRINTLELLVQNGAVVLSTTLNNQSSGDIILSVGRLAILSGGQVAANSLGGGPAGSIRIDAIEGIVIAGRDPNFEARLAQIPEIGILGIPQSALSVRSSGEGAAGNIIIGAAGTTPRLVLENGGQITAESAAVDGGNIVMDLNNLLLLRGGSQISTTAGTAQAGGDGGNITLRVPFIVAIPEENSDISADAFEGAGGNVNITAGGIFGIEPRAQRTPLSDITASSELGVSGIVELNVLDTGFIENGLAALPDAVVDTEQLIAGSCIARAESGGSFIVSGRGGLPDRPSETFIAPYATGSVRPLPEAEAHQPLQEPDGLYHLPDGRVVLSRACN